MAMTAADIETLIKAALPDAIIDIRDLAGDGDHYAANVISEAFRGKTRVQQHQLVYNALKGGNITLKPKNYEPDSGPGLLGDIMGSQKNVGKATKGTPAKSDSAAAATTTKTKEARRLHECGSAPCAPCAARARRARLALTEAMRRRSTKVKGRSTCY